MSPQVARNKAARLLFEEVRQRCPDIDREYLRQLINEITLEELRLVRRDLLSDINRDAHYHGGERRDPGDIVITARKVLDNIDRRIGGER